ncbi:hypothetical protein DI53_1828 [Sphingobacterium deserti]|uniref:Uncharacterized protein n=1 Tax=Sphingobacterium deserti TaxID=1229276 RepID=A0A0B8T180_9SPHI|nr:hypothetical protein DI53_1828 [Sphingobacterium deserti]
MNSIDLFQGIKHTKYAAPFIINSAKFIGAQDIFLKSYQSQAYFHKNNTIILVDFFNFKNLLDTSTIYSGRYLSKFPRGRSARYGTINSFTK